MEKQQYWLVKSEPDVYSFEQLQREGHSVWEGVRNYQARNFLRAMRVGDLALFYHSNIGLEVVGIAKITKAFYPDPTAEQGDWSVVEVAPVKPLEQPVSLKSMKANPLLADLLLIRNGRLSVMPVPEEMFAEILRMGATSL